MIDSSLFIKNRRKFEKKLKKHSLAIFHSNDEMPRNGNTNYPFRQNSDLFYLCGVEQEKTILAICPDFSSEAQREILFILKPDKKVETWQGSKLSKKGAKAISGIKTIYRVKEFEKVLSRLLGEAEHIYLDISKVKDGEKQYLSACSRFSQNMGKEFPGKKYYPVKEVMEALRVKKEPEEIEMIKRACDITGKAFYRVLKFVKPGVAEYKIEAEITHEFIRNRTVHAYLPIIASGENTCTLHYIKNERLCGSGDLLLLDFGAEYANYASDCSRTIPVSGKFSLRQRECYDSVLRVMKQAIQLMQPGKTIKEIHAKVCRIFQEEMVQLGLFTREELDKQNPENPLFKKYYMHGISHFIGLDVHDTGTKTMKLAPGMVLSCEPGIYIPEEKIGIRLENNILLTENGPVDLMAHIPIEPDEVEALMKDVFAGGIV